MLSRMLSNLQGVFQTTYRMDKVILTNSVLMRLLRSEGELVMLNLIERVNRYRKDACRLAPG
jgi:hypothetical protein